MPYLKLSWLSKSTSLLLFFLFGGVGFTLNAFSYKQNSFGNPSGNRLHWIGTTFTFVSLISLMLHVTLLFWGLFIIGLTFMALGLFRNAQLNQTPGDELDANE